MSGVEHEVYWAEVEENWCILDTARNTWWVMGKRLNRELTQFELLLENGQGQRVVVSNPSDHRVTMVLFTFDDRIALIQEIFRRGVDPITAVTTMEEVHDGPDTLARRVSG